MKNIPKAGLLIITLVIPALIFMFLSLFGRNHYDLPHFKPVMTADRMVLMQKGDTVFQRFSQLCASEIKTAERLTVVYPVTQTQAADSLDAIYSQLQRIEGLKTEIDNLQLIALTENVDSLTSSHLTNKSWTTIRQATEQIDTCLESLSGPEDRGKLILLDTKGQIRGYYTLADSEEADRLMAEIKILKYENGK